MGINKTLYHVCEHLQLRLTKYQTMEQFTQLVQWPNDSRQT